MTWERDEVIERWKAGAESREQALAGVTDLLFAAAGIRHGMRVLDCGCGSGEMTRTLAVEVGASGSVLAVDGSDAMLALARETNSSRPNVEFRHADVATLGLGDDHFDAAVARCLVMLLDDPVAACRAIRSHLKPGARFACSVWTENNPRFAIPKDVLTELGHPPQPPAVLALVMRLADDAALARVLSEAGFEEVHTIRVRADARYPEPDVVARDVLSTPAAQEGLAALDEASRRRASELILQRAAGYRGTLPAEQTVAMGTNPAGV